MDVNAQMDAATKSTRDQLETIKTSIENQLDTADRVVMLRAVDATIRLAQAPVINPQ